MFLTLLSTDGGPVRHEDRVRYASRLGALGGTDLVTVEEGAFYALAAPAMVPLRSLTARRCGLVAIGNVRLDNREEVRLWGGAVDRSASDLELVLQAYDQHGVGCIHAILGDFAFVIYNPRVRTLVAGRDAFGVKTLFIGRRSRAVVLSSHLQSIHDRDDLDEEFIADFLVGGDPGPERTVWADSQAVPQGSILTLQDGNTAQKRFWTPYGFRPTEGVAERDQVEEFRELFREAVRLRIEPRGLTWAELSGGLDSSSVVCMAQSLANTGAAPDGVKATVSVVDQLGGGDESRYSRLVVQLHKLRNETIVDPWPWQHDGQQPVLTDEPRAHYPYVARDKRLHDTVTGAGGKVLLTGLGSDHYLYGNRFFFADLLAQGHVLRCAREVATWAITERRSIWTAIMRDVAVPLLPSQIQRWLAAPWDRVPSWVDPDFARRTLIADRLYMQRTSSARRGSKFSRRVSDDIHELTYWLPRGPIASSLELRHPFLYRPLVEFGLTLSVAMRVRPGAQKWVLREAMRNELPEAIRTRPGKGAIDARFVWALSHERDRVDALTRSSRLVQEGYVRQDALIQTIRDARACKCEVVVPLLCTLALETWLSVACGRWSAPLLSNERDSSRSPDNESPRKEVTSHDQEALRCS
jgi:asparagine synthase (glutamine-hydrolysing)